MSGENRRPGGWILPVIVVAAGAAYALYARQNGTLSSVTLKPVNWVGLALMVVGAAGAFFRKPLMKLAGVLLCGIGAILVICL